jgi:hypothetical protein
VGLGRAWGLLSGSRHNTRPVNNGRRLRAVAVCMEDYVVLTEAVQCNQDTGTGLGI